MQKPETKFDLTSEEGIKRVVSSLTDLVIPPFWRLARAGYDNIFESTAEVAEAQAKTAERIIRAGAKHNVAEIDITLCQEAGAKFGGSFEGADLHFKVGREGIVTMNVKYRNATRQLDQADADSRRGLTLVLGGTARV